MAHFDRAHFQRDAVLSPSLPYFKISEKILGKRYRPSYTEIFLVTSRLKKCRLAHFDRAHFQRDVVLSASLPYFKISEKTLGKRYRPSYTEIFPVTPRLKRRRLTHFDLAQIPLDPCIISSVVVPDSSMTLISVKVAREAAQKKLPLAL